MLFASVRRLLSQAGLQDFLSDGIQYFWLIIVGFAVKIGFSHLY